MKNQNLQDILSRVSGVTEVGANRWKGLCPAHADHNASLSIGLGSGGKVLLYCHAGCPYKEIRPDEPEFPLCFELAARILDSDGDRGIALVCLDAAAKL